MALGGVKRERAGGLEVKREGRDMRQESAIDKGLKVGVADMD